MLTVPTTGGFPSPNRTLSPQDTHVEKPALHPRHGDVAARLGAAHLEAALDVAGEGDGLKVLEGAMLHRLGGAGQPKRVAPLLHEGRNDNDALVVDEHGRMHLEVSAQSGDKVWVKPFEDEHPAPLGWSGGRWLGLQVRIQRCGVVLDGFSKRGSIRTAFEDHESRVGLRPWYFLAEVLGAAGSQPRISGGQLVDEIPIHARGAEPVAVSWRYHDRDLVAVR